MRRDSHLLTQLFLFILMAAVAQICAQTTAPSGNGPMRVNNGAVAGRAIDAAGAILRGAIVRLTPGDTSTVTDGRETLRSVIWLRGITRLLFLT